MQTFGGSMYPGQHSKRVCVWLVLYLLIMGSRARACVWLVVYVLIICCAAAPHLSSACVHPLHDAAPTASGYLPINQSSGSKMFFAYYEARESQIFESIKADDGDGVPILLWLQGGPGCSGMVGNFYELGPWHVGEDECLHPNADAWNRIFGLLFLDSPVGSGFSIAPLVGDIPTDLTGVTQDVYTALEGFFDQFPALSGRPFYITGESYAGKFVPSVATYILEKQGEQETSSSHRRLSSNKLRLDGVAIGNGFTHPIAEIGAFAPTAYFMGLVDEDQREEADALAAKTAAYIEAENWLDAYIASIEVTEYLQNVTGLATLSDVRRNTRSYTTANGTNYLTPFMNKEDVQRSLLNAELLTWTPCSDLVLSVTLSDVTQSAMHMVEALLNQSIPVLLYQGQFDLSGGVAVNEAWMRLLQWDNLKRFYASERKVWKENDVKVGYVRSYDSLTHVVISNAGHHAPADQPYAAQRMIERWVCGVGFNV